MIIGPTAKEQLKALRTAKRVFVLRAKLIDSRTAWFGWVWKWYPDATYWEDEKRILPGLPHYSRERPERKHVRTRKPKIPVLQNGVRYDLGGDTKDKQP